MSGALGEGVKSSLFCARRRRRSLCLATEKGVGLSRVSVEFVGSGTHCEIEFGILGRELPARQPLLPRVGSRSDHELTRPWAEGGPPTRGLEGAA